MKDCALYPLVKQQCKKGNGDALQQIQRCHAEKYKGGHIADIGIDRAAHGDNGVQRQTVKLGEFRKQIDGVECRAEHG